MKNDLTLLKENIGIKKYEWIPIIGTIIYVFRINMLKLKIEDKGIRKIIVFAFGRIQWPIMITIIPFIVTFFVIRHHNGFGAWPWPFFVALSLGISQQLTPIIYKVSLNFGIKKLAK